MIRVKAAFFSITPPAPPDDDGRYFDVFLPPAGRTRPHQGARPDPASPGPDYPHHEGTYPHSQETVALLAKPLEQADALQCVPRQRG